MPPPWAFWGEDATTSATMSSAARRWWDFVARCRIWLLGGLKNEGRVGSGEWGVGRRDALRITCLD